MFRVDVPKVRGKMAERNFTLGTLSHELGISRNTLCTYLKNPGSIPYATISKMAEILCDNSGEAASIFFAINLRNA